ncbi:MAG: transcriptional repressor LexA [Candidatus Villigracilaceae bacterium]
MMMVRKKRGLSERHIKILEYLEQRQGKGYPPSIREICDATEISSTSVVNYYLKQLEEWGYIMRNRRISRGVRIIPEKWAEAVGQTVTTLADLIKVPVLGRIVAGSPVPIPGSDFNYYDAEASVEIARSLLPEKSENLFALEVQGDSMIDAMVNDGDIVIMKPATNAETRNGDMVAVWLEDRDETTLKYFYKEANRIRLQPANPTMSPIYVDNPAAVKVQGKVVMVIRKVMPTAV